jgi:hypothetical protein
MGISASQARLLTITARLTSNEYESQQISNAKMRLASQSEQVSRDYIAALNSKCLQFMTYDAQGTAITEDLTANAIYQYSDMKNQYVLVNNSGQALISSSDVKKFKACANLDEFLASYGIEKQYKSKSLAENAQKLTTDSALGGVKDYYEAWVAKVEAIKNTEGNDKQYEIDKYRANEAYGEALKDYQEALAKYENNGTSTPISDAVDALANAKQEYADCMTYDAWAQAKARYNVTEETIGDETVITREFTEEYLNVEKYYEVLSEFLAEAENLGCTTIEETYEYSDKSKAQWYTNLWYRMNGESSEKSAQDVNAANYTILDSKLAASSQWIQDALSQGLITIEVVSNENVSNILNYEYISATSASKAVPNNMINNPLKMKLRGINWRTTEFGTCSEFVEKDDNVAIARAEAEYERKNKEISAKDKRYENKIKTLDTEHQTLQTEYESVQTAMNKNIERSYKTVTG